MVFTRPMVPLDWWYDGYPRKFEPSLNFCLEGDGRIELSELRSAVEAASAVCPGAQVRRKGKRWVDSGIAPRVRAAADVPVHDRLPRGRCAEVVLVRGTTVVFRVSHAVMDARGLKMWATEVFRALRGDTLGDLTSVTTVLDLDEPLLRESAETKPVFDVASIVPMGRGSLVWRRRTVDGTQPAIVAKVAAEVARLSGLAVTPVSVPVDLRVFHPELNSTANLSIELLLQVDQGESWESVHRKLLTVLAERHGVVNVPGTEVMSLPRFAVGAVVRSLDRKAKRRGTFSRVVSVNNLGRVDPEAFSTNGFAATAAYWLGPPEPGWSASIDIIEFGGRTELTVTSRSEQGAGELLGTLAEALAGPPRVLDGGPSTGTGNVLAQFAEHVRESPSAIAVSGPDGELTYAGLDRRARGIAAALRKRGVGPGAVVGLLADRHKADVIAGAWGVLMAGAAYLPMDVKHPDSRLRALLSDADVPVCLVQGAHAERAALPAGCQRLVLEDLAASPASDERFPTPSLDDLAYVVYTSGSTGDPKGVEVSHRALSNYASWACREHGFTAKTRLPLLCSPSFDVAEITMILPLLAGGRILLMGEVDHVALQSVLDAGATALALTPSLLDLMTRLDLEPRSVGTLMVIGEQFTRALAVRAREMFGQECDIINLYGPAEATIGTSHHFFADDPGASVPIGRPRAGVTYHVLSPERAYVKPGEEGELYIGGVQLARGYRGRPGLTRQSFVRMASGERVYRTGDVVRELPSGALEHLGRVDDQVKIFGHRIEPAEIALTIESHPDVAAAVVVPRSRPGRHTRTLVGYVIGTATAEDLAAHVADHLPSYMAPSMIIPVSEIPRSVNGKVAVDDLPDPFESAGTPPRRDPLDDDQAAVARIFADLLKVDTDAISGGTDFHALGGDSVSLITMVAAVARDLVGPEGEQAFTARTGEVIKAPTVERIAELMAETRWTTVANPPPASY